jgi:hypothetical protein
LFKAFILFETRTFLPPSSGGTHSDGPIKRASLYLRTKFPELWSLY